MHLLFLLCLSPPRRIGENQLIVKVAQQIAHWRGGRGRGEKKIVSWWLQVVSSFSISLAGGGGKRKENFFMMSLSSVIVVLSGVGGGRGIGTVSCYSYLGEGIMCQLQRTPKSRAWFKPRLRLEHLGPIINSQYWMPYMSLPFTSEILVLHQFILLLISFHLSWLFNSLLPMRWGINCWYFFNKKS